MNAPNKNVAAIFGLRKIASEPQVEDHGVDLAALSAQEVVDGLVAQQDQTDVPTDADLAAMSAEQLVEAMVQDASAKEVEAEKVAFEKMAQSGELAHLDRSARYMAHALWDEFVKIAFAQAEDDGSSWTTTPEQEAELPERLELDGLTGLDLDYAVRSNLYEIVAEKTASSGKGVKAFLSRAKDTAGNLATGAKDVLSGKQARDSFSKWRKMGPDTYGPDKAREVRNMAAGAAKTLAAGGGVAAGGVAAAAGAKAAMDKKNES